MSVDSYFVVSSFIYGFHRPRCTLVFLVSEVEMLSCEKSVDDFQIVSSTARG